MKFSLYTQEQAELDRQNILKWDRRFIRIAREVSNWSKDPSTKVGVVLVKDRKILGTGYNGFPRGIADTPDRYNDRDKKYPLIVHAEVNAILNCERRPEGATVYIWPGAFCCSDCAKVMIQSGIARYCGPSTESFKRWGSGIDMLKEADITIDYVELED